MLRQITSRVRASSLSLRTQVRRSFTLDISSAKSRATNWEPALRLPPNPPQNNASDIEDTSNIPWVATYSAFDPDMIRSLLMSGPSWTQEFDSVSENTISEAQKAKAAKSTTPEEHDDTTRMTTYSAFDPDMICPLLPSVKQSSFHFEPKGSKNAKPWLYSLLAFLQSKAGITFEIVRGGSGELETTHRIGGLQALLYGVLEPGNGKGKKGVAA
jgi:hypothetical protein